MGLVADVAIVVQADVEAISGESGLTGLDQGGATLAAAMVQATNFLMLDLRGLKSVDPAKVSNVSELKIPAALMAAHLRLIAQPDAESQGRAALLKKRYDEAFGKYVFVSTDVGSEQTVPSKGLPRGLSLEPEAFFPATDNRRGGRSSPLGWSQ